MARFCTSCGAAIEDNKKFCTECGTPTADAVIKEEPAEEVKQIPPVQKAMTPPPVQPVSTEQPQYQKAQPTYQAPPIYQTQPTYQAPPAYTGEAVPGSNSKYEPISTAGYIGIMLLACIPVVGIVIIAIWAFGGCRKINKRNYARASLIMMAIALILSFFIGLAVKSVVGKVVNTIEKEAGLNLSQEKDKKEEAGGLLGLLGNLAGTQDAEGTNNVGTNNDGITAGNSAGTDELSELTTLLGMLGGSTSGGSTASGTSENSDLTALGDLGKLLGVLEGISGGEGSGNTSGLADLINNAESINKDAESNSDGWPKSLRQYPGGKATAVASYRTEITGTTKEEMLGWIEELKKDGFEYQDFYDFGMSEADMLEFNGWWATDGNIYLSISFSEGTVIVDHMNELPDMSSLFG